MTKEHIIRESAALFNTKGYSGSSLSEIIQHCGIQKGGIYNHFGNKDEIALAAFDYSFSQILQLLSAGLENAATSRDKLFAVCQVYIDLVENKTMAGGCPLLNTAVESDDTHPLLQERAQQAMRSFIRKLSRIIQEGIEQKEFKSGISPEDVSVSIIAMIEGGVMLSKLFEDSKYIRACVQHVKQYIDGQLLADESAD